MYWTIHRQSCPTGELLNCHNSSTLERSDCITRRQPIDWPPRQLSELSASEAQYEASTTTLMAGEPSINRAVIAHFMDELYLRLVRAAALTIDLMYCQSVLNWLSGQYNILLILIIFVTFFCFYENICLLWNFTGRVLGYVTCTLCVVCQSSADVNPDFVFHEGPQGPPGQKGEKGDIGLPGEAVRLPTSSQLPTKGLFLQARSS